MAITQLSDEIQWVKNIDGKTIGFAGLNGKVWHRPHGFDYYGDIESYKRLSMAACGMPSLSDEECELYEELLPMIGDSDDSNEAQIDELVAGDSEWWYRKQLEPNSFEQEYKALSIAETLIAKGWRKNANNDDGGENKESA